ncbi:MAG: D-alanine--D-alanine ligase [Pseudohongiellaceae bacterium]|nr:D-alanine--D-alanine ligase [Pseudohongiellaceae bacterium]
MSSTPNYAERFGRVAVVMGGKAAEREVSLNSGNAVLEALLSAGIDAIGIDAATDLPAQLIDKGVDRVFNVLHGRGGEDGQLQGLLEFMEIPYTGSGVLASALSMDKERTKRLWLSEGLPTPQFEMLTEESDFSAIVERMGTVVVKPVREGSSIGMSIVSDSNALRSAYEKATEYDSHVMAEQYIRGPELSVPVLNGTVLPIIELKTSHEFYDYEAKYIANDTEYTCPAPLADARRQELEQVCLAAFNSAGCSGWGRVDVMQDKDGKFWLLELNTVPGMTDHSLVPMAAKQKGLSFVELLIEVLDATVEQKN